MSVVFVPGFSWNGSQDLINFLNEELIDLSIVQFGFQKDDSKFADYKIKYCVQDYEERLGKDSIVVAKSFGSQMPYLSNKKIAGLILLAPSVFKIGIKAMGQKTVEYSKIINQPFNRLDNIIPGFNRTQLRKQTAKTIILHGTKDSSIPLENSYWLKRITGAELIEVDGADHGFEKLEHKQEIIKEIKSLY